MTKRPIGSRWQRLQSVSPFFIVVALYVVACLALGGGTREGFIGDVVLQGFAVPLLLWAGWRLIDVPAANGGRRGRATLAACLLIAMVPLAQLVPLSPSLWMRLPGRSDYEGSLMAAGLEVGWQPLSVVPSMTWLSFLALLPPAAVLLGVLQLSYTERWRLSLAILSVGLVSVGVGLLQVAQGPTSSLRFYALTNDTEAVGFFANRNHYAALLYCLVLVAAAFSVAVVADFARAGLSFKSTRSTTHIIAALSGFAAVFILVAAQAMARSRAGLGLTAVALMGAFALAYLTPAGTTVAQQEQRGAKAASGAIRLLAAAILLACLFGLQFAVYRMSHRFHFDPLTDARVVFARNTIDAAIAYMPFGSGLGTFVSVYPGFEKASDNMASAYANRAHNDYLELWLEAGLAGLIGIGMFLIWAAVKCWRVWRRGLPDARHRDNLLACAAALAMMLLLAHASVEYHLRTAAMMAVFAWTVAMVMGPVGFWPAAAADDLFKSSAARRERRERSRKTPPQDPGAQEGVASEVADAPPPAQFVPAPPRDDWPESWRPPNGRKPSGE